MVRRGRIWLALATVAALLATAGASANHSVIGLVTGGSADVDAAFAGMSANGERVFFATQEALDSADVDSDYDVYERSDSGPTLRSGTDSDSEAHFVGASADGSRVLFHTPASLDPADVDAAFDIYESAGGSITLISGGTKDDFAAFKFVSSDGTRVLFETSESLTAADLDTATDVYEASGGNIVLLTPGSADLDANFAEAPADGAKVLFHTFESLDVADGDTTIDVYEATNGDIRLLTGASSAELGATLAYASADGSRVHFHTVEALEPADVDEANDVYEAASGVITLLSGGTADEHVNAQGISVDGSRSFFHTNEALVSADTDTLRDVYEASNGSIKLLSGGNSHMDVVFARATPDGSRVFFHTQERLVASDVDNHTDTYEASNGELSVVTIGTDLPAGLAAVSANGRVFVYTLESLDPSDVDTAVDVYEVAGGYTLVTGGSSNVDTDIARVTHDGTKVFFHSTEALVAADVDSTRDVYAATIVPDTASIPVVTISVDAADTKAGTGWYNRASSGTDGVAVHVSATHDREVANVTCLDGSTEVLNEAGASGSFVLSDSAHSIACTASDGVNAPGAGQDSTPMPVLLDVDQTVPTISCAIASPGSMFGLRDTAGVVSATVTDSTSGPASGLGSAAANLDTVGNKSALITGEDVAGNSAITACPYRVSYRFLGFRHPSPTTMYKRGTKIPVKFMLADASGATIPDADASSLVAPCRIGVVADGVELPGCATYNANFDWFQYGFKTPRNMTPGSHVLAIKVFAPDGSGVVNTHAINVTIRS